ncbi:hypothetical protein D1227_06560 [Henriciella mobilis]|uniref:hypothetical protein n=1 Tax=Henriciella mobilis TaxID=2305467 RepID=UPI000E66C2E2|nr:hypothetical protein [Henriciella mobilis]RIJ15928.1 hypothetical protein D1231_09035 [Henriciella mobilis]RIJ21138.1 hypothetical protein D1227_12575 [Henriciella mobilis]RIJ23161.1 hypothetical protein D1227_06560 [Henriciella mobilis]
MAEHNLHISYDLYSPGQKYDAIKKVLERLGVPAKVHYSFWYLKSPYTPKEVGEAIWSVMDQNDSLYVVDAATNVAYWFNVNDFTEQRIQRNWNQ